MTICYFGNFDPAYSRNRILINGLKKNNIEVLICNDRTRGFSQIINLIKKHWAIRNAYDILIVGYSDSRAMVPLAKILSTKKVVWDAFYSLYDSWVFDRKFVSPHSFKARYYWLLDKISCWWSDLIVVDTHAHEEYFITTFTVEASKLTRILVGADDEVFYPRDTEEKEGSFLVHFHGKFIPLQGVRYIIEAAHILKDEQVTFQIIGNGQEYPAARSQASDLGLNNIVWIDPVPYEQLPSYMERAHLCLGIFGETSKTGRVIPNKIYEAVAMAKPVVTANTSAVRELFTDQKNILVCETASGQALADKILELVKKPELRERISRGGLALFRERATPRVVAHELLQTLKQKNFYEKK